MQSEARKYHQQIKIKKLVGNILTMKRINISVNRLLLNSGV
jgi:hypothetical protein